MLLICNINVKENLISLFKKRNNNDVFSKVLKYSKNKKQNILYISFCSYETIFISSEHIFLWFTMVTRVKPRISTYFMQLAFKGRRKGFAAGSMKTGQLLHPKFEGAYANFSYVLYLESLSFSFVLITLYLLTSDIEIFPVCSRMNCKEGCSYISKRNPESSISHPPSEVQGQK